MEDIASMSEEELTATCRRNRLEQWLHGSGCVLGLFCGIVASATIIMLSIAEVITWSWCFSVYFAVVAFFISALSFYGVINMLVRLRCGRFLTELEYRYGCRPLVEYVREATRSVSSTELVLLLVGRTLPIYQHWWVCIRIDGGITGTVEARFGPILENNRFIDFGSGENPKDAFKVAKGQLEPEMARRLADLAGRLQRQKINVPSTVKDGFPITCALILGTTKQTQIVSCNLAGIPKNQNQSPHVLVVKEALSAAKQLIDAPSGFGGTSCGIQIGGV